jgi:hypothetical protein
MNAGYLRRHVGVGLLVFSLILVTAIYCPGLSGGWLFDDYPNFVDNQGVQPTGARIGSLVGPRFLHLPASSSAHWLH